VSAAILTHAIGTDGSRPNGLVVSCPTKIKSVEMESEQEVGINFVHYFKMVSFNPLQAEFFGTRKGLRMQVYFCH
jgi:hypothetical protein